MAQAGAVCYAIRFVSSLSYSILHPTRKVCKGEMRWKKCKTNCIFCLTMFFGERTHPIHFFLTKLLVFKFCLKIYLSTKDSILQGLSILPKNIPFSLKLPTLEKESGLVTVYLQASICHLQEYWISGKIFQMSHCIRMYMICLEIGHIVQNSTCRIACIN